MILFSDGGERRRSGRVRADNDLKLTIRGGERMAFPCEQGDGSVTASGRATERREDQSSASALIVRDLHYKNQIIKRFES